MKSIKLNILKKHYILIFVDLFLSFLNKFFRLIIDKLFKRKNLYIVFLREDRIGHQGNADVEFLKAVDRFKKNKSRTIFVFAYPQEKIANKYLRYKLIKFAKKNFYKVKVIKYNLINNFLKKLIIYSIPKILISCKNIYFSKNECGPRLSKNILGKTKDNNALFENLGIKSRNYICIYARDSKFLKSIEEKRNWDYMNFRDSNIDNLKLLSDFIVDNFGWDVIRIGSDPYKKIEWEKKSKGTIIDYSFSGLRSEKNDIDLLSNCRIFIGNGGPASIAICSRREIIRINQVPMGIDTGYNYGLWIPKLHYYNKTKKYLSLMEICEKDLHLKNRSENYKFLDIILKENSSQDILEVFKDYIKFKNNSFSKTEKLVIKKYHRIRKKLYKNWNILGYGKNFISPSFLIKYDHLLDD